MNRPKPPAPLVEYVNRTAWAMNQFASGVFCAQRSYDVNDGVTMRVWLDPAPTGFGRRWLMDVVNDRAHIFQRDGDHTEILLWIDYIERTFKIHDFVKTARTTQAAATRLTQFKRDQIDVLRDIYDLPPGRSAEWTIEQLTHRILGIRTTLNKERLHG